MDLDQQEVWSEIYQLPTIPADLSGSGNQGRNAIHSVTGIGGFIDSLPEVKEEVEEKLLQEVGAVGEGMFQVPCTAPSFTSPNTATYPYSSSPNSYDAPCQPVEGENKTERSAHGIIYRVTLMSSQIE